MPWDGWSHGTFQARPLLAAAQAGLVARQGGTPPAAHRGAPLSGAAPARHLRGRAKGWMGDGRQRRAGYLAHAVDAHGVAKQRCGWQATVRGGLACTAWLAGGLLAQARVLRQPALYLPMWQTHTHSCTHVPPSTLQLPLTSLQRAAVQLSSRGPCRGELAAPAAVGAATPRWRQGRQGGRGGRKLREPI